MDFYEEENRDGVRFTWNSAPASKAQASKVVMPLAVHYTPMANIQIATLQYTPLTCKCQAVLNKFNPVNFTNKTYTCLFCNTVQQLPPNYSNQISPDMLPYEMTKECSTFQCKLIDKPTPQAYLFVVDLCMVTQEQLAAVKQEICHVVGKLPAETSIGLITFNKFVHVHELTAKINTVYCVSGVKDYNNSQILEVLGLPLKNDPRGICHDVVKKFIVPIGTNRQKILKRIKDVKIDQNIYVNERPQRATSSALNIAIALAQASPIIPRIVSCIGGPCTIGQGKVVDQALDKMMRTQMDIHKNENVDHFAKAIKYYEGLAKRLIAKKIVVDLFIFYVDQVGLIEMRKLVETGGGFLVMQEEFKGSVFRQSFKKVFLEAQDSLFKLADEAQITILTSKDMAISGILGQCTSLKKKPLYQAEVETGQGATSAWHLGGLDSMKTLTVLLETTAKDKAMARNYFMQFKTIYRYKGCMRMRVTTVCRPFAYETNAIAASFDEQAAVVALSRLAVYKSIVEQQQHTNRWLDKLLFKFTSHFANYTRNDIHSFSLPPNMKSFPQFMYHLRRSQFISTFGTSPDECYYYRFTVYRENVTNCISMIQPALLEYSLDNPTPQAVMLDEQSMKPDVILLLDAYFQVLLWQGPNIKSWQDGGYHEMEGYQHVRDLLNSPNQDVDYIVDGRFPTPTFFKTYTGHSKQRYLKSRVNPKKTGEENENFITDDANIKTFTEYLVKLVVTQPQP